MMQCPSCGVEVDALDHFCASCGAPLRAELDYTGAIAPVVHTGPASSSGALGAVQPGSRSDLPTGSALLVVHRGPGEGSEFTLAAGGDVYEIGRSPEADIFLDDVTVSRRHAQIRHGAEGWSIQDSGSLNGTYVNRKRVNDRRLAGGDEVQIGKFRFIFLVGAEPER